MKNKVLVSNTPGLISKQFTFKESHRNLDEIDEIKLAFEYEASFSDKIRAIMIAKNIEIIGGQRLDKLVQSLYLSKFDINHPKTYFNESTYEPFKDIQTFDSYVDLDEFVVKPIVGARGVGVKKITRSEYKRCLENEKEVSEVFKEEKEYMEKHTPDVSSYYIESSFRGDMLVQEPIDVDREFRLLIFKPDNFLIYERAKTEGQFCGNLSHGSKALPVEDILITNHIKPLFGKIQSMMSELKYPWLSVDVYIDKSGNVGIFEFQMEFAYEGFKPKEVKNLMTQSILHYITESKKPQ